MLMVPVSIGIPIANTTCIVHHQIIAKQHVLSESFIRHSANLQQPTLNSMRALPGS